MSPRRREGSYIYTDVANARRYTLVVGAGINASRQVPGWAALVRMAWQAVFRKHKDYRRDITTRIAEARSMVKKHCGWSEEDAQRLDVAVHPLEPQFALELIELHLRENPDDAKRVRALATDGRSPLGVVSSWNVLALLLARCLYADECPAGTADTLSELARFIRRSKRLVRVISLNVDNLLELEVANTEPRNDPDTSLQVISRARHRPGTGIPTYHLHGFLPQGLVRNGPGFWDPPPRSRAKRLRMKTAQDVEHMTEPVPENLVFTDTQYWQSVATPLSFANFVFANALHDSSCIFIGLSMTDLNIIRWLGLYAAEFRHGFELELRDKGLTDLRIPSPYIRHCWIRSPSGDPTGLITRFLERRGIHTRVVPNWRAKSVRKALDQLMESDARQK